MAKIVIRQATTADAATLAAHRVSMFRDMGSIDAEAESALTATATEAIRETLRSGEYMAWVAHPADEPNVVIAGAGVQLRRLMPRPAADKKQLLLGREGIVLNVYVERSHRRRGIARDLMNAILAWVPSTDIVQLVLHASGEGRPLYEQIGFRATNEMRYGLPLPPQRHY